MTYNILTMTNGCPYAKTHRSMGLWAITHRSMDLLK